jgi:hypothetical protein
MLLQSPIQKLVLNDFKEKMGHLTILLQANIDQPLLRLKEKTIQHLFTDFILCDSTQQLLYKLSCSASSSGLKLTFST